MTLEPDKNTPSERPEVEIDFFGAKITVPKNEYDACMRLASLDSDTVMLHEIINAATDPLGAYLPEDFKEQIKVAILSCAGNHPAVRAMFTAEFEEVDNTDDLYRSIRITVAQMSKAEALSHLPNVPLRIGEIRESVEDMACAAFSILDKNQRDEFTSFFGENLRVGIRMATLRFFSTYFDALED